MGLRDRLRERQLPQATIGIRMDWTEESYRLHRELELEESKLKFLFEHEGDPASDEQRAKVETLRAQVDRLYEFLTVRAIPAADFEALLAEHKPSEAQQEEGLTYDRETFFPALLAACVEGTETPEDWSEMIHSGELVMGEVNTLISTAMQLNDRSPSVVLGKGSTTTSS